jgi:general secretion pathway protein L
VISRISKYVQQGIDSVAEGIAALLVTLRPAHRIHLIQQSDGQFQRATPFSPSKATHEHHNQPFSISNLPADADLAIRCDAGRFLSRSLVLPSGARSFLDGIVRSQIDRLTPWSLDDAAFGWAISEDTSRGVIVCIVAAEKSGLLGSLSSLRALKAQSAVLSVQVQTNEGVIDIPLDFQPFASETRATPRRLVVHIALLAIFLAIIGQIAVFVMQSDLDQTLATLQAQEATLREAVISAKSRLSDNGDPIAASAYRKRTERPVSEILNALAKALPDTTFLSAIDIENGVIHIEGVSSDVTRLPELVDRADGLFEKAAFTAPTVRQRSGTGDVFRLDARITPTAEPLK